MTNSGLFWKASVDDLKRGYIEEDKSFICLLCGKEIDKGIVYPEEGIFYEAKKYTELHIKKVHHSVFDFILSFDRKLTGLTDHQINLLRLFYLGKSDAEIKKELNIGSTSTIRNHRFLFKERERQSKLFLVLMELLKEKDIFAPTLIPVPKQARMVDGRYNVTEAEKVKILKKYFPAGSKDHLKNFPSKVKEKLVILGELATHFEKNQIYDENVVNQIIKNVHPDYVTIRRYLIKYGFLDRKPDGSQYWLKESLKKEEKNGLQKRIKKTI